MTAIDLGLPSGTKWCPVNVGAVNKEDSGLYFSWGNTEGHAEGSGYEFSQAVYDTTPAAGITTDLSLSQDAARANLGSLWRLPTAAEFQELYDNCTHVWVTRNGVAGCLFTSNVNGNSIFFPAAGRYSSTTHENHGTNGFYWSSKYGSDTTAMDLRFDNESVSPHSFNRRNYGFSIRAVIKL